MIGRAWVLLVRNPVILVPGIVIGGISAGAEFGLDALPMDRWVADFALFIVTLALALAQMAYVTGMAGAAWRGGIATLRDGWEALKARTASVAGAAALLLIIGFCAATLAPATFAVTLLAYALFFIYTMAAVVIGGRSPVAALVESASTALANVLPTLGVVALIVVIAIAGGALGSLAGRFSQLAGWLVAGLLQQVIVAYASLVVAGEYLQLTKRPTLL
ncbi:MAG TPA: hypothetical protein VMF11_08615 [Candidatus Baltobacteraceae bacterium]|nr:hypothetical protein [Candidatus Baltobacteraceae bacterium]